MTNEINEIPQKKRISPRAVPWLKAALALLLALIIVAAFSGYTVAAGIRVMSGGGGEMSSDGEAVDFTSGVTLSEFLTVEFRACLRLLLPVIFSMLILVFFIIPPKRSGIYVLPERFAQGENAETTDWIIRMARYLLAFAAFWFLLKTGNDFFDDIAADYITGQSKEYYRWTLAFILPALILTDYKKVILWWKSLDA